MRDLFRRVVDVPIRFQLCILKTVQMHVEFTFSEWLILYSWPLRCTVESSSSSQPVPGRIWRTCKVSALYLENCANERWINVFWGVNPSFLTPLGYSRIVSPSTTCAGGSLTYLWSFNFVSLKTVRMHGEFTFFEWLTLYSYPHRGQGRIVNLSMTRRCEFQLCISITVRMCVEFRFLWLTLYSFLWITHYSWPLRGYDRIVNLCATFFRRVVDVPIKFQLCILKTVQMHVEFTFSEWLTLYSWPFWSTVESSTPPRPVPGSCWRTCEVSTLYLENCAYACWIHMFLSD